MRNVSKQKGFWLLLFILLPFRIWSQEEEPNPGLTYDPVVVTSKLDVMLSQHWAMPTLLNPAATGDIDYIRVRGGARLQWLGLYHDPKNFLVTADSPFKLMGKRIGAGIIVNSESRDLYRNLLVSAQGSYKFQFKQNRLSIGVQIGYYHSKFKGSEMIIHNNIGSGSDDSGDEGEKNEGDDEGISDEGNSDYNEDLPTQDVSGGRADISVGLRFEHPKFYVGLSGQHITNSKLKMSRTGETSSDTRYIESKLPATLYFEAGGNIQIPNSLFTLQPSIISATDFSDFAGIVEMRATYNQLVTFGVDYRYNQAVGVMAGLTIKNFFIGYSWEYDYTPQAKKTTGNHEVVIGYQFKLDMGGKNLFSHRSIRIM